MTDQAKAHVGDREAFEKWYQYDFMGDMEGPPEWQHERNCYVDFDVHMAWKGWQARAALSPAPQQTVNWPTVDEMAQYIRWLNGKNAGNLAEELLYWLRRRVGTTAPQQAEQGAPVTVEAVAMVIRTEDGLDLDWLLEGGIAALAEGETLLICGGARLTDNSGSGEVYLAPPAPAAPTKLDACNFCLNEARRDREELKQAFDVVNAAWMAVPEQFRDPDADDSTGNPLPAAVRALAETHHERHAKASEKLASIGYIWVREDGNWVRDSRAAEQAAPTEPSKACGVCGIRYGYHTVQCSALAAEQAAPKAEQADEQILKERDEYHDAADQLAGYISEMTGQDIGEHSSENNPWVNACEAARDFLQSKQANGTPGADAEGKQS